MSGRRFGLHGKRRGVALNRWLAVEEAEAASDPDMLWLVDSQQLAGGSINLATVVARDGRTFGPKNRLQSRMVNAGLTTAFELCDWLVQAEGCDGTAS